MLVKPGQAAVDEAFRRSASLVCRGRIGLRGFVLDIFSGPAEHPSVRMIDRSTARRLTVGAVLLTSIALASTVASASVATSTNSSPLVGRWSATRTCQGIVNGLRQNGLLAVAPSVAADYFPNQAPTALARKSDICSGAKSQLHSHFFTTGGKFGSLDQNGKQVDDGNYRLLNASTVRINDGAFRFRIVGKFLSLTPLLTPAQKRRALARPLQFSTAGWMVVVAYPGHTWKRVPCEGCS
jgi:hypothetical protein